MLKNKEGNLRTWLNLENMKLDFIKRDIEELGLDENCKISIMTADEIEETLGDEFLDHNVYFTEDNSNNIIEISGYSPVREKNVKVYYIVKDETIIRQLREYNYKEELKEIHTVASYKDGRYLDLDEGSIQYACDENGFKKYVKISSDLIGDKYWIFNENGEVEFEITDEYVRQLIKDGDKEYTITDGYFKPTDNGFICLPSKAIEELENEDIQRTVFGDVSEEDKKVIIADLTEERKEQIINAIKLITELEWFTQEVELDYVEEFENQEIEHPTPEEVVEESIKESIEELRESGIPYTLEQFIKDTKDSPAGVIRPYIICKDGYTMSVQANSCLYCMPEEDCLEKYNEYEVRGETSKKIKEFEKWVNNSEDEYPLYAYVPEEEIIKLINKHNGLDKKIMKERIEEWQQIFESQDTETEKMIKEVTGGNSYLETIMRYAARYIILKEKNIAAKKLLDDYEKIDNSKLVDDEE